MSTPPLILRGLSEIAGEYDGAICDVWGVVHNGLTVFADAVAALKQFRATRGPVVLLSNAPRPVSVVEQQFERLGVPADCYDKIVTSGVATRDALERMSQGRTLSLLHIGPERDRGIFEGLPIACVGEEEAEAVLCTGPWHDDVETPEDYRPLLTHLKQRGLELLCANPDVVVQRGDRLIYCAGALAQLYEEIGGTSVYFGKPHPRVYEMSFAALAAAGRRPARPLALGDGLATDIHGANRMGLDAVFIADGIHGADVPALEPEPMKRFFEARGADARAVLRRLVW